MQHRVRKLKHLLHWEIYFLKNISHGKFGRDGGIKIGCTFHALRADGQPTLELLKKQTTICGVGMAKNNINKQMKSSTHNLNDTIGMDVSSKSPSLGISVKVVKKGICWKRRILLYRLDSE
jgi:hypothetical protein